MSNVASAARTRPTTSFLYLENLLASDAASYRREIERMKSDEPERLDAFVEYMRQLVNRDARRFGGRERRHSSMHRFMLGSK